MTVEPVDLTPNLVANLRDLGGLRTEAGGSTRPGVLLRSAAPLAGDRHPGLASWPPATVLDLRGLDELSGRPHPLAEAGSTVHALPLLDKRVHGPNGTDWSRIPDLATAYVGFLTKGGPKLAATMRLVAEAGPPVLVHCAAGKDRTGVVVAVLLRAAGVSRDAVIEDYRRTEPELPVVLARIPELTAMADPTHVQRLMGVPTEAIVAVLDLLDAEPGGTVGWLEAQGATRDATDTWRRRLVG
jgi:protein-tyrosine phosphatase